MYLFTYPKTLIDHIVPFIYYPILQVPQNPFLALEDPNAKVRPLVRPDCGHLYIDISLSSVFGWKFLGLCQPGGLEFRVFVSTGV